MRKVPELSLLSYLNGSDSDKKKFVTDLFNGLKEYGFIILTDHTVSDEVMKKGYEAVHKFYSLPVDIKLNYVCPKGGGQRGYTAFGIEHAKDNNMPDLKEFWHVGREVPITHKYNEFYPRNIWPTEVPEFKEHLENLYKKLDLSAQIILEALGQALDVPSDFFKNIISDGNSILRPIHYPPLGNKPPEGSVRAASHEDINIITILMGATDGGLELLDKDGTWLPVVTKPGQLIVDSGDMMKVVTNDVLPATTHRVANPKDLTKARYSMPFFVHPNPEAMLACIPSCVGEGVKYEPINGNEFLKQRLREIGLM
jgi:isopenicillin N synthase-like dioxygenase